MVGLNEWLQLIFITLLPGVELRGSIPYGILVLGLDPALVFLLVVTLNVLLVIPTYFVVFYLFPHLRRIVLLDRLIARVQKKAGRYVDKYGFLGLMIFVGIPLPGSGIYSGVIAAHFLGIKKRKAIPAMTIGVIIAGILMLIGTLYAEIIWDFFQSLIDL